MFLLVTVSLYFYLLIAYMKGVHMLHSKNSDRKAYRKYSTYSNRRRPHVHIIRQYNTSTMEYLGLRVVIYKKNGYKEIFSSKNFKKHRYKSPKRKKHSKSRWKLIECTIENVMKKKMSNYSVDKVYYMEHVLYESDKLQLDEYIEKVFTLEGIDIRKLQKTL